jgi:hypothetical protein
MTRNAFATLAMLAALSSATLPAAQALPTDTIGTPGGGQSASPDGSSETRNDGRYQNSLESGLLRGAQQQCNQWWETSTNAYRRAKEAEARGDQEAASYWYGIQDEYLSKWEEAQCKFG